MKDGQMHNECIYHCILEYILSRMGNKESNESAAVKRQAEGFSNPMYQMLDLGVSCSSILLYFFINLILIGWWTILGAVKKGDDNW